MTCQCKPIIVCDRLVAEWDLKVCLNGVGRSADLGDSESRSVARNTGARGEQENTVDAVHTREQITAGI